MELYLFPGGYGGISLVEGDVANLCLVIRRANLRKLGGWPQLFRSIQERNPHLAQRLQNASTLWDRPLAVSSIPYGYLAGRTHGLWSVGDQAACIPSFTGDGMSIALHSAALAAQMFLDGASADTYHRRLATQLRRGMSLATALSRTLVTPLGRTVAPVALSLYPGALAWIARSTRIPASAIDPQLLEFTSFLQKIDDLRRHLSRASPRRKMSAPGKHIKLRLRQHSVQHFALRHRHNFVCSTPHQQHRHLQRGTSLSVASCPVSIDSNAR